MNRFFYVFSFIFLSALASPAFAQISFYGQPFSIIDALQESAPGKGTVEVQQSVAIRNLLGVRGVGTLEDGQFIEIQGFRAQVFTGNLRNSKDEAFKRENEIKELFPNLVTYVTYVAPFWRLRVGDYRSHEEAYHTMRTLMDAFPSYAKEMYIVREDVKISLY